MKLLSTINKTILLFLLVIAAVPQAAATNKWAGYKQQGKASYYADKFQNRKTASGELYKHSLKTAAHNKLPMGTRVKVTNLANKKSITVKINDRGPYVKGRIIDLSKSAFQAIGSTKSGLMNVKMEVLR